MSEETKLQVLDNVQQFKDRVAESVRSSFGMLIPEEDWQKMVENEVSAFFEEELSSYTITKGRDNFSTNVIHIEAAGVTPFRAMIWAELQPMFRDRLKNSIREKLGVILTGQWDDNGNEISKVSENLEQRLEEMVPKLVAEMFRGILAATLNQTINEISMAGSNAQMGRY